MKCIVKDCKNHSADGGFTGLLCNPCFLFITEGIGIYSQAYRNALNLKQGTREVGTNQAGMGACIFTDSEKKTFELKIGDNFFHWISNPAPTKPHGQTVGQLNRAWIMEELERFIDKQWEWHGRTK